LRDGYDRAHSEGVERVGSLADSPSESNDGHAALLRHFGHAEKSLATRRRGVDAALTREHVVGTGDLV